MVKFGKMAAIASSQGATEKSRIPATQLNSRLQNCWSTDIDWEKYPKTLREVLIPSVSMQLILYMCMIQLTFSWPLIVNVKHIRRDAARLERQFASHPQQCFMA